MQNCQKDKQSIIQMPSRFTLKLEDKTIIISHEVEDKISSILIKIIESPQKIKLIRMTFDDLPEAFQHVCFNISDFYDYLRCNEEKVIKITHEGLEVKQVIIKGNKTGSRNHNVKYIALIKNLPLKKISRSRNQQIEESQGIHYNQYEDRQSPDEEKRKRVNRQKERSQESQMEEEGRKNYQCKICVNKKKKIDSQHSQIKKLKLENDSLKRIIQKMSAQMKRQKDTSLMVEENEQISSSKHPKEASIINSYAKPINCKEVSFTIDLNGPDISNFIIRSNFIIDRFPGKSKDEFKLFGQAKSVDKDQYFAVQILAGELSFGISLGGYKSIELKSNFWFDTKQNKLIYNQRVIKRYDGRIGMNDAIGIFILPSENIIQFQHNSNKVIYRGQIPEEFLQAKEMYPFAVLDGKARFKII